MVYFDNFRNWFLMFMRQMLGGIWQIISNIFLGIGQIFNFSVYSSQLSGQQFGWAWILVILVFLLTIGLWAGVVFLIVLGIRKYIRFRRSRVGSEDLLEEIAQLHRDVVRLNAEKERIIEMKMVQAGVSAEELRRMIEAEVGDVNVSTTVENNMLPGTEVAATVDASSSKELTAKKKSEDEIVRFARLSALDEKYDLTKSGRIVYDQLIDLPTLCNDIRNFACANNHLFYDIKTIRLMIAGLAMTKLIILQGISGTGKTSLPYMLGKFLNNDATVAPVQPSWRDKSELFGYFNEFSKKFNETDVLTRIYESGKNSELNLIILDEMNISRVEYYFAEMLSIMEMPEVSEWKLELVPSTWAKDPKGLADGKLIIPQNLWYVGTANNDDSTFSIADKVYDRAFIINLNSKGKPFQAEPVKPKRINYRDLMALYNRAIKDNALTEEDNVIIKRIDDFISDRLDVTFGNRILKQLNVFLPVYVACGGDKVDGLDYFLTTKLFRKFEMHNMSRAADDIKGLIRLLDDIFGKDRMAESIRFLTKLQKTV